MLTIRGKFKMTNFIEITVKSVKKIRDMAYNGRDEFFSDKTLKQFKLRKQKTKTVYVVELKSDGKFYFKNGFNERKNRFNF